MVHQRTCDHSYYFSHQSTPNVAISATYTNGLTMSTRIHHLFLYWEEFCIKMRLRQSKVKEWVFRIDQCQCPSNSQALHHLPTLYLLHSDLSLLYAMVHPMVEAPAITQHKLAQQNTKVIHKKIYISYSPTVPRMRGQLIPQKNACCFISLAPPLDPNRLLGSLFNNMLINCLHTRLTCTSTWLN